MISKTVKTSEALRALPAIDTLLRTETGRSLADVIGLERLTNLARRVIDELRQEIIAGAGTDGREYSRDSLLAKVERRLAAAHHTEAASGIRRVINATGVILHTNLGRAPLSDGARRAIEEAAGYCNLEYDLTTGTRGRRGARAESLIAELCGAEAALIVNNCAAAALLVLSAFAREGETIVSRGELVEIGGDFRVPDVMAQSGTRMVEVGTTNRTRLADYAKAISDQTRLLMRVHTSNYRIVGFTKTPITSELAELAHERDLLLYEDAGSGALIDLTKLAVQGEPVIRDVIKDGADVVSFSGDKLLGGPQAGFLVGRSTVIEQMRRHPLYRALRADKLRLAAIEATLESYARGVATAKVPALRMITMSLDELETRAENFIKQVQRGHASNSVRLKIVQGESAIGGGAAPTSRLATPLISITHAKLKPNQIEERLRRSEPPVIARIDDDCVLLDLRTVAEDDEERLALAVAALT
jgi:L-seryl-tRNA(Ser) seleniumtransferase